MIPMVLRVLSELRESPPDSFGKKRIPTCGLCHVLVEKIRSADAISRQENYLRHPDLLSLGLSNQGRDLSRLCQGRVLLPNGFEIAV